MAVNPVACPGTHTYAGSAQPVTASAGSPSCLPQAHMACAVRLAGSVQSVEETIYGITLVLLGTCLSRAPCLS